MTDVMTDVACTNQLKVMEVKTPVKRDFHVVIRVCRVAFTGARVPSQATQYTGVPRLIIISSTDRQTDRQTDRHIHMYTHTYKQDNCQVTSMHLSVLGACYQLQTLSYTCCCVCLSFTSINLIQLSTLLEVIC